MGTTPEQFANLKRNIQNAATRSLQKQSAQVGAGNSQNPNGGTRPELQEQPGHFHPSKEGRQEVPCVRSVGARPAANRRKARIPGIHAKNEGAFRLTIVVSISDNRGRDVNGAASTLLDVLRDAARDVAALSPELADWIAVNVPLDDSHRLIPGLKVLCRHCQPGAEGAVLILEPVTIDIVEAEARAVISEALGLENVLAPIQRAENP